MTFAFKEGDVMYGAYAPGKSMNVLKAGHYYHIVSERDGVTIDGTYYPPGQKIRLSPNKVVYSLANNQPAPQTRPSTFFLD